MDMALSVWGLLGLSMATGLVAGVFLTFSDFVMPSLRETQPAGGTEAMQIINRKVYRSIFMVLLIGMIPISAAVGLLGAFLAPAPIGGWLMAAGVLYGVGVFAVSAGGNIPMNNRLEAMAQGGAAAQAYWPAYVRGWVRWNHIRWVTALGAAWCYAVAAVLLAGGS